MLQVALSDQLIITMAGNHLKPNDDFYEFIRIDSQVIQQLEMTKARIGNYQNLLHQQHKTEWFSSTSGSYDLNFKIESQVGQSFNHKSVFDKNPILVRQLDSSGDTIMGDINATGLSNSYQR